MCYENSLLNQSEDKLIQDLIGNHGGMEDDPSSIPQDSWLLNQRNRPGEPEESDSDDPSSGSDSVSSLLDNLERFQFEGDRPILNQRQAETLLWVTGTLEHTETEIPWVGHIVTGPFTGYRFDSEEGESVEDLFEDPLKNAPRRIVGRLRYSGSRSNSIFRDLLIELGICPADQWPPPIGWACRVNPTSEELEAATGRLRERYQAEEEAKWRARAEDEEWVYEDEVWQDACDEADEIWYDTLEDQLESECPDTPSSSSDESFILQQYLNGSF